MTKTMSIRMDRQNDELSTRSMRGRNKSDLSKAVRDLVTGAESLLAVEKDKKGEASLAGR